MATESRVVLDARLDGGQLWIVTDPDDPLRRPERRSCARSSDIGARPQFRSFWVAPTGFERRWSVAVDEAPALRALLESPWPVTPALGTLLEVFVEARRIVDGGHVLPGPVPIRRDRLDCRAPTAPELPAGTACVDAALAAHPEADELAEHLVHTLAAERIGPVPTTLDGRAPTAALRTWTDRVRTRRRRGRAPRAPSRRLLRRFRDSCRVSKPRRATTVIVALDPRTTPRRSTTPAPRWVSPASEVSASGRTGMAGRRSGVADPARLGGSGTHDTRARRGRRARGTSGAAPRLTPASRCCSPRTSVADAPRAGDSGCRGNRPGSTSRA